MNKTYEQLGIWDLTAADETLKLIESTDWKWSMRDDYPSKNGLTVFSCFAGGGGSTMGYKLAGCDVIGDLELDRRMNSVYVKNHSPKYNFLMDIRDFNSLCELPEELYNLDILDGSPPCSTFSIAGDRENAWGKEKRFREGQKLQTLDDLVFIYIDTVAKLRPKVAILENVEGLLLGNAYEYVKGIYRKFGEIGYHCHHWLLKAEFMGVPQTRHRVFFVATRLDFDITSINMNFSYCPIIYSAFKSKEEKIASGKISNAVRQIRDNEGVEDVMERIYGKRTCITHRIAREHNVFPTVTAGHGDVWLKSGNHPSALDIIHASTFPEDYDFDGTNAEYICGMSVPPIMIKRIATRLIESGLFDYKLKGAKND